jgi:hypothetical protein
VKRDIRLGVDEEHSFESCSEHFIQAASELATFYRLLKAEAYPAIIKNELRPSGILVPRPCGQFSLETLAPIEVPLASLRPAPGRPAKPTSIVRRFR